MEKVNSYADFLGKSQNSDRYFLLLYKSEGEQSRCALQNLEKIEGKDLTGVPFFMADVSSVRDIHAHYGITSVPSLLIFEEGKFTNLVKGCQESQYYEALTRNAVFQVKAKAEGKTPKRVTVYSTPTCSWCNALKAWLRKNGVPFSDIDVSRDEKAAQELIRRTGKHGVPQTDINGRIIVGFDQSKLKELLEIQ